MINGSTIPIMTLMTILALATAVGSYYLERRVKWCVEPQLKLITFFYDLILKGNLLLIIVVFPIYPIYLKMNPGNENSYQIPIFILTCCMDIGAAILFKKHRWNLSGLIILVTSTTMFGMRALNKNYEHSYTSILIFFVIFYWDCVMLLFLMLKYRKQMQK